MLMGEIFGEEEVEFRCSWVEIEVEIVVDVVDVDVVNL